MRIQIDLAERSAIDPRRYKGWRPMDIILFVAAVGFVIGIVVGVPLGRITLKQKALSIKLAILLVGVACFCSGIVIPLTIKALSDSKFNREFTLKRDIDLVDDNPLNIHPEFKAQAFGILKKGSVGIQTFHKGSIVYADIPVSVSEDDIDYIE